MIKSLESASFSKFGTSDIRKLSVYQMSELVDFNKAKKYVLENFNKKSFWSLSFENMKDVINDNPHFLTHTSSLIDEQITASDRITSYRDSLKAVIKNIIGRIHDIPTLDIKSIRFVGTLGSDFVYHGDVTVIISVKSHLKGKSQELNKIAHKIQKDMNRARVYPITFTSNVVLLGV